MGNSKQAEEADIRFLYFEGCPNAARTQENLLAALDEIGLETTPQVIEVDPAEFDGPFLGSPSVLVNGIDVYTGSEPDVFQFSCRTFEIDGERTGVLPVGLIRDRIKAALER